MYFAYIFTPACGLSHMPSGKEAQTPSTLRSGTASLKAQILHIFAAANPSTRASGGATVETFATQARRLADLAKPDFVIVALGGNDALRGRECGFQERMTALLASLAPWPVLVVPLPPGPGVKDVVKFNTVIAGLDGTKAKPLDRVETTDGIHLTPAAYVGWQKSIAYALPKSFCAAQISN